MRLYRYSLIPVIMIVAFMVLSQRAGAQCPVTNTAFQAGERLSYQLFFNWKFVWVKAGTASMITEKAEWKGEPAYRSRLITQTSSRLDKFFMMRDTLHSLITTDLVPRYYKKAANEGGKYYVDQVWYTYADGKTLMKQQYLNRQGVTSHATAERTQCVYDMMSMMLRARSLNPDDFQVGQKLNFPMADGTTVEDITLIYRGRKNFKMKGTGVTYRCIVLSFVEYEKGKEKEIITFYISDDQNHIPVRLDMYLKFGIAKAYLSGTDGLLSPSTSIIEKQ